MKTREELLVLARQFRDQLQTTGARYHLKHNVVMDKPFSECENPICKDVWNSLQETIWLVSES